MLKGQVALVTGGARGIGKEIAIHLARENAIIAIADLLADEGKKAALEISEGGGIAEFYEVNLTKSEDVQDMVKNIISRFGRLDILINNAGNVTHPAWCYEMSNEDWVSVINTHVNGMFYCLKAAAKVMKERRYGRIVNISSIAAIHGYATLMNYAAAKAAIVGITLTAAKELGPHGITVNCLQPGIIITELSTPLMQTLPVDLLLEMTPTRRFGTPLDVAHAVRFLVDLGSDFITGAVVPIDGGFILPMIQEQSLGIIADSYLDSLAK